MDYFATTLANNILLRTRGREPAPPNLCAQNSLFPAAILYKGTHSFGMLFVNTVTMAGDTFRTALPL